MADAINISYKNRGTFMSRGMFIHKIKECNEMGS
jgi:hypothetical protein